jgi:hypothetical protein
MTPYSSYRMYWASRQRTRSEQRAADEQIGRLAASLSNALARLRRPRRRGVRRVGYGSAKSDTDAGNQ